VGNNILLLRAHGNTISRNVLTGSDMMGIFLVSSGSNLVEHNVARDNDAKLYGSGCGIMLSAADAAGKALSANNVFRHNVSSGNPLAGIMIRNAGTGTVVSQNVLSNGGRLGLQVWDTQGALLEGNVMNNNRGLFTNLAAAQFAKGLDLQRSGGSTVRRNIAFGNGPAAGSFDFFWDVAGVVSFDHNRCGTSQPAGLCKRGDD
jgi:parallel beta-helix repeat protein